MSVTLSIENAQEDFDLEKINYNFRDLLIESLQEYRHIDGRTIIDDVYEFINDYKFNIPVNFETHIKQINELCFVDNTCNIFDNNGKCCFDELNNEIESYIIEYSKEYPVTIFIIKYIPINMFNSFIKYIKNGKIQTETPQITFGKFDESKLEVV